MIQSFTKQTGGLPSGKVKLPSGSNPLAEHTGGLGGNSKFKSYPKWVRNEINGSGKVGRTIILADDDFSDSSSDSDDSTPENTAPPKTEKEAEKSTREEIHQRVKQ